MENLAVAGANLMIDDDPVSQPRLKFDRLAVRNGRHERGGGSDGLFPVFRGRTSAAESLQVSDLERLKDDRREW